MLVGPLVCWSVGPYITSKTDYVAIASRRGEGRGNRLMSKTGYVKIALRLVTVTRSCFFIFVCPQFFFSILSVPHFFFFSHRDMRFLIFLSPLLRFSFLYRDGMF
jgi:hypothetical protein